MLAQHPTDILALVREIFHHSADGAALMDVDQQMFVYGNPQAHAFTGLEHDTFLHLSPRAITRPEHMDAMEGLIEEVQRLGSITFEHRFFLENYQSPPLELSNTYFESGGKRYILTLMREISKQAEARVRLEESEEKWRSLVENAPGLIITIDRDKNITFMNRSAWFDRSGAVGRPIADFANPAWRDLLLDRIDEVYRTGNYVKFESHGVGPGGKKIWYSNQIGPIHNRYRVAGATIITTDVTEQIQDKEELVKVEKRLNEAQRIAQIGNWEWHFGTDTFWWSDQLFRICEMDLDGPQPTLSSFLDRVLDTDRSRLNHALRAMRRNDAPFEIEFRLRTEKQNILSIHAVAHLERDHEGEPLRMMGIARDVTERKRVLKALERSQARLSEAQQMAHLGAWTWELESDRITWSDEIFRILGFEPASFEASLDRLTDAIHEKDRTDLLNKLNRAMKEGEECDVFHRIVTPEGLIKYVVHKLRVAERIGVDDALVSRIVGTMQDVTEQKKAEVELAVANKMLLSQTKREQRVRSTALIQGQEEERSRLSRELHDGVGQMLSAIKFSFGMLAKRPELSEDGLLKIVEIKELIDLSITEVVRVSNNLMPSVLRDFGLVSAIQKIIKMYQDEDVSFLFTPVGVEGRLAEEVEVGLFRIAQEAVNNTMKYADASEISIVLENVDDKWIILMVSDNGIGFELEGDAGHGNGILNMKERADHLRGKLNVASEKGKGTVISVEIPLTP